MTALPERILVVGAGTMGRGIVETAAVAGIGVDVVEPDAGVRTAARDRIARSIETGIRRGKVDLTGPQVALDRIAWHAEAAGPARDARFVIEAVPEDEALKTELFDLLDAHALPKTNFIRTVRPIPRLVSSWTPSDGMVASDSRRFFLSASRNCAWYLGHIERPDPVRPAVGERRCARCRRC